MAAMERGQEWIRTRLPEIKAMVDACANDEARYLLSGMAAGHMGVMAGALSPPEALAVMNQLMHVVSDHEARMRGARG